MVLARGFCYAHTFLHSICSYTLLWWHGYFSVWRNSVLGRSAEGGQQKKYQASEYHGMDGLIRALCRLRHASFMRSTDVLKYFDMREYATSQNRYLTCAVRWMA